MPHDAARELPYPKGPSGPHVTPALTAPSKIYKRNAALATLGLFLFVGVYLGLTAYLGFVVWRLLGRAILEGQSPIGPALGSIPALFFLAFLVRGLFVMRRGSLDGLIELREADEPDLFAFIRRLADETGAPRPHRVFLSARVNAGVFFDLSFRNLVLPTKKNLEIGLGVVNVLTLDELKAVLAHELGHFAQRTMAVGRWVYVAQQIAGHIVVARGGFDRFLSGLSNFDLRVAWIGWIMRLFVWALRAVLDTVFRIVVIADRALSREMEFQADRVAVSVCGSDSLIHALHRLSAADEAWEEALSFVLQERNKGRGVADMFAIQTAALEHLRRIRGEPDFGRTPRRPDERAGEHRVFAEELAQPPAMWSTHPPNREREDHAKLLYLASELDDRPASILLRDPARTRADVTAHFLSVAIKREPPPVVPIEVSLQHLAERYSAAALDPRYHGIYLGRAVAAYDRRPSDMIDSDRTSERPEILARLDALYPSSLADEMSRYREQRREEMLLKGLEAGILTAPGGVIKHRGKTTPRKHIASIVAIAKADREATEARILAHDRKCRAAHLDAARLLGDDWHRYLESLIALLHYATHTGRAVSDAIGYLHHVLAIVLADGRVSNSERERVLGAASDVYEELMRVWREQGQIHLPPAVRVRFDNDGGWMTLSQKLGLSEPVLQNLGDWITVVDGWAIGAAADFHALADAALDALLEIEDSIARHVREERQPGEAPEPARVPLHYLPCAIGSERERQKELDLWDRFQTADGVVPGTARFVVASALVLPALFLGGQVGSSATIHVHNGLAVPVTVAIGSDIERVAPHESIELASEQSGFLHIVATAESGEQIDAFDEEIDRTFAGYVYNVGRAAPLVQYSVVYGVGSPPPERRRGNPRWMLAGQDYVLSEPPRQIRSNSETTRSALAAISDAPPVAQLDYLDSPDERRVLVTAHVRFDPIDDPRFSGWLAAAEAVPGTLQAVLARADANPGSVWLQRAALDSSPPDVREGRCVDLRARSADARGDLDLAYLAIRCLPSADERDAAYLSAHLAHPQHGWLARAATLSLEREGRIEEELAAFDTAFRDPELAGLWSVAFTDYARAVRVAQARGIGVSLPEFSAAQNAAGYYLLIQRVEQPPEMDDTAAVRAFRSLVAGEPDEAVRIADDEALILLEGSDLLALAAASSGASDALVARARAASPATLSIVGLAATVGLAQSRGWDSASAIAELHARMADDHLLPSFVDALDAGPLTAESVERAAAHLDLLHRGAVLLAGTLALGADAPPAWRTELSTLLFPIERPYFAPGP